MTFDKVPPIADERHWKARRFAVKLRFWPTFRRWLMRKVAFGLMLSTSLAGSAAAQLAPPLNSRPEPTAKTDTIPAARDIPYPGTIKLTVDATDVTRGIFQVHEQVPVAAAGDFVLLYPE